jgi:hypothetical protein
VTREEIRSEIARYGAAVRDFFHAGQRATLISPLFNVPARLVVGSHCFFEHAPDILRRVSEVAAPEDLGAASRAVGRRPNGVGLNSLALGYLNGREQRRLAGGIAPGAPLPDERIEDTATLMDFWRRFGSAYVDHPDGFLPGETAHRMPILPPESREELLALTRTVISADERVAIRRMMAVTELYTFIQNGEARVGVFNHGPYPLPGGDSLVVKELVGLRDRFLDWDVEERPHVDAVARVMRLCDVSATVDLFGSLVTDPFEFEDRIVAEEVVTVEDGRLRPLGPDELASVAAEAAGAQVRMYEQAAEWSPDYRVAYGADLYASLLVTFTRAARLDLDDEIRARFRATADRVVPGLRDGVEQPLVLGRLGARDGELYSPVLPDAVAAA